MVYGKVHFCWEAKLALMWLIRIRSFYIEIDKGDTLLFINVRKCDIILNVCE